MSNKQKVYSAGYKFQTSATPTTNMAEMEWINELWAETSGDPRIYIAVLDGPVDRSHAGSAQYLFTEASGSPTRLEDLDVDLSSFATRTSVSKFRCVASWRRT